jgi:hypothetical protein
MERQETDKFTPVFREIDDPHDIKPQPPKTEPISKEQDMMLDERAQMRWADDGGPTYEDS